MSQISNILSAAAITLSAVTLWLTVLRRGSLKMTKPTLIFFGTDGGSMQQRKIVIRTHLFSTSQRGITIENMFVKLWHKDVIQTFGYWGFHEEKMARGTGLFVDQTGVTYYHHFVILDTESTFRFQPGPQIIEVYASLFDSEPRLLDQVTLTIDEETAKAMEHPAMGLEFNLEPERRIYVSHLQPRPMAF